MVGGTSSEDAGLIAIEVQRSRCHLRLDARRSGSPWISWQYWYHPSESAFNPDAYVRLEQHELSAGQTDESSPAPLARRRRTFAACHICLRECPLNTEKNSNKFILT
jgi:hypothetical protein